MSSLPVIGVRAALTWLEKCMMCFYVGALCQCWYIYTYTNQGQNIGTVLIFMSVSWRKHEQSESCFSSVFIMSWRSKEKQNAFRMTKNILRMVSISKDTRSSTCECFLWRSFRCFFLYFYHWNWNYLPDPHSQWKSSNEKNATTTGLLTFSVFLR